jgi:hypothetical protein
VVPSHSNRTNRSYLNRLSDPQISPPWCGVVAGDDEEWGGETFSR